jgi:hypothetical protein
MNTSRHQLCYNLLQCRSDASLLNKTHSWQSSGPTSLSRLTEVLEGVAVAPSVCLAVARLFFRSKFSRFTEGRSQVTRRVSDRRFVVGLGIR